ncbi:MAG: hypothetical protein GXO32_05045 [Crenarchaeota archaeon]|nr:hypothetical protein [Thermoproteota archaeon]
MSSVMDALSLLTTIYHVLPSVGRGYGVRVARTIVARVARAIASQGVADAETARVSPAAIYLLKRDVVECIARGGSPRDCAKRFARSIERLGRWSARVIESALPIEIGVPNGREHRVKVCAWVEYGGSGRYLATLYPVFPTDPPKSESEIEPVVIELEKVGDTYVPTKIYTRVHYKMVEWGFGRKVAFMPFGHTPIVIDSLPSVKDLDFFRSLWLGIGWIWGRTTPMRFYELRRAEPRARPADPRTGIVAVTPAPPITGINPFEARLLPRPWSASLDAEEVARAWRRLERRKRLERAALTA